MRKKSPAQIAADWDRIRNGVPPEQLGWIKPWPTRIRRPYGWSRVWTKEGSILFDRKGKEPPIELPWNSPARLNIADSLPSATRKNTIAVDAGWSAFSRLLDQEFKDVEPFV